MRTLSFPLPGTWARFDLAEPELLPAELDAQTRAALTEMAAAGFAEVLLRTGTSTPTTISLGWFHVTADRSIDAPADLRGAVALAAGPAERTEVETHEGYLGLREDVQAPDPCSSVVWLARPDDEVVLMAQVTTYGPEAEAERDTLLPFVEGLVWTDVEVNA